MKTALAVIVFVLLAAVGASAQPASSLSATLQWMHTFAHAHAYWDLNPGLAQDEITFKGCQAYQMQVYPRYPESGRAGETYSLTDLDPNTIKAGQFGDNGSVDFETTNSRETIAWYDGLNAAKQEIRTPFTSSWRENFDTLPNAERFAKAFKHAVILCGGKSSAF